MLSRAHTQDAGAFSARLGHLVYIRGPYRQQLVGAQATRTANTGVVGLEDDLKSQHGQTA